LAKFSRQALYGVFNKIFPPSSTGTHQPSMLTDSVQLVHPAFSNSWWLDGCAFSVFNGALAATSIATDTVPSGRYRIVLAAHGNSVTSAVAKSYGLNIFDPGTGIDAYVDSPAPIHQQVNYPAAFVGVAAVLGRPIIIPQGNALAFVATAADAAMQLQLRYLYRELTIGEPF